MSRGFPAHTARAIAGITQRRLSYWAEVGVVCPSVQTAHGSGSERLYSFTDLVKLRIVAELRRASVSLQHIRAVLATLDEVREIRGDVSDVLISLEGRVIRRVDGRFEDVLTGQQVLGVVFLGRVAADVEGQVKTFPNATISGRSLHGARVGGRNRRNHAGGEGA
jgi:DNA-binding transcriptional MerR regulator